MHVYAYVHVYVHAHLCMCMCVCVCARACVCMRASLFDGHIGKRSSLKSLHSWPLPHVASKGHHHPGFAHDTIAFWSPQEKCRIISYTI